MMFPNHLVTLLKKIFFCWYVIEITLEPVGENQSLASETSVDEHGACLRLVGSLSYHSNVLWFTL